MTLEKQHMLMMQASAKLQQACIFCCLETLLMARMCKLSAQGCKSVSRRWGHVCVLHAHFAAQLCWGGIISSASLQDLLVSLSAPQRAVFFSSSSCFCCTADVWSTKKTAERPVYPACFQSKGQKLDSHRYQGGTGEVWLFSAWLSAKMSVSALFPSAPRLMLQLNILPRVKKNQSEFAF